MREIETESELKTWLDTRPPRDAAACQALDLRAHEVFEVEAFPGCAFLGCELTDKAAANLVASGAIVLRADPSVPYKVHRSALYTAEELFDGLDEQTCVYADTFDFSVYQHYLKTGKQQPSPITEALYRRLHDHSITDALNEAIEGKKVVAVMGGHSMERREEHFRTVAQVSRRLAREGFLLVSGGGPGAMEATHLGVWFAGYPDDELDGALEILRVRPPNAKPKKEYDDPDWLLRAWKVRRLWPDGGTKYDSIGIPTWLYGHEPPTPFASRIAKYFANSVREEGLLAIAKHGVVFAPGSAGTTQEIFQDAAQNHYATFGGRSPMILLGREYWTTTKPVWPVLQQLAQDKVYDELLAITDSEDAIARRIRGFDPTVYEV